MTRKERQVTRMSHRLWVVGGVVLSVVAIGVLPIEAGATVVLSGCSTGRGRPAGGDVMGLTSAFLYAGAIGIIAGLWRVDDAATAELMTTFYREISNGQDTANALQQAQLQLLRSERYARPYFWAPFSLNGDRRALT